MRKSICIILSMLLAAGQLPLASYGFKNPLKSYNLYEDVHRNSVENPDRETVMGEMFYSQNGYNKQGKTSSASPTANKDNRKAPPASNPTSKNGLNETIQEVKVEIPQRRNDYLRESSKKRYASGGSPRWTEDKAFYARPSMESIIEKYRRKDYAGCMQECEAYVKASPNDTLAFYYLAMCYANANDKENAVKAYEQVISLNSNPMIVKYATNGRNCILKTMDIPKKDGEEEKEEFKCFENVNEPDYVYPYRELAKSIELTPVDPQALINKNVLELQNRIAPITEKPASADGKKEGPTINLPFGTQDSALDEFIRAPYGSGLSPELEKQYKQIQLHEFQQKLNNGNDVESNPGKYYQNLRNIKNDKKSDSDTIKLAMADNNDLQDIFNSPEFIQNKKEIDQINMMFGDYKSEKGNELMDIIPALSQGEEKLSPQAMQMLMMQSVMPDIINIDGKNTF